MDVDDLLLLHRAGMQSMYLPNVLIIYKNHILPTVTVFNLDFEPHYNSHWGSRGLVVSRVNFSDSDANCA